MSDRPTKAQLVQLERAARDPRGIVNMYLRHGFGYSNWQRMMHRMCARGWFTSYVHGGYEITEVGRTVRGGVR
jgi:hypothetical protein